MTSAITSSPAWRPIETAPKDNSPVIIFGVEDDLVQQARWWPKDGGSIEHIPGLAEGWHYDNGPSCAPLRLNSGGPIQADAWMPLPEPPVVTWFIKFDRAA